MHWEWEIKAIYWFTIYYYFSGVWWFNWLQLSCFIEICLMSRYHNYYTSTCFMLRYHHFYNGRNFFFSVFFIVKLLSQTMLCKSIGFNFAARFKVWTVEAGARVNALNAWPVWSHCRGRFVTCNYSHKW